MLELPDAVLRALAGGEIVAAFTDRATVEECDEVDVAAGRPPGEWDAVVVAVHPAASLDAGAGYDGASAVLAAADRSRPARARASGRERRAR